MNRDKNLMGKGSARSIHQSLTTEPLSGKETPASSAQGQQHHRPETGRTRVGQGWDVILKQAASRMLGFCFAGCPTWCHMASLQNTSNTISVIGYYVLMVNFISSSMLLIFKKNNSSCQLWTFEGFYVHLFWTTVSINFANFACRDQSDLLSITSAFNSFPNFLTCSPFTARLLVWE